MKYEKISEEAGKTFTWSQDMPLSELKKPEVREGILRRYEERKRRLKKQRANKTLVETLAGLEVEDDGPKACLICQL